MKVYGVIMAGGGGTRFWPLSRQSKPKQLLNLTGNDLMINETIDRIASICSADDIFIVTNKEQAAAMESATKGRININHILKEPMARNTAACIGYAAMEIIKKYGDGIMCVFPADHYIKDQNAFEDTLREAIKEAENDYLITMGITPTYACTGYGYIKFDRSDLGVAKKVIEFKEKPDEATAIEYVASGEYAWNSGMFVWKASTILKEFEELLPDVFACLQEIGNSLNTDKEQEVINRVYPLIPKISIDYGIMEKATRVKVVAAEMGWNDVGSWDNLGVLNQEDKDGNVFVGNHIAIDTKNCITYSKKRMITTLGVSNLIVVETEDAIMVVDKNRAQDVKQIVDELNNLGREDLL